MSFKLCFKKELTFAERDRRRTAACVLRRSSCPKRGRPFAATHSRGMAACNRAWHTRQPSRHSRTTSALRRSPRRGSRPSRPTKRRTSWRRRTWPGKRPVCTRCPIWSETRPKRTGSCRRKGPGTRPRTATGWKSTRASASFVRRSRSNAGRGLFSRLNCVWSWVAMRFFPSVGDRPRVSVFFVEIRKCSVSWQPFRLRHCSPVVRVSENYRNVDRFSIRGARVA